MKEIDAMLEELTEALAAGDDGAADVARGGIRTLVDSLRQQISELRREVRDVERDCREEIRAAVAEAKWNDGGEY